MSVGAGLGPVRIGGLSDEELVHLARGGDESAFNAIVQRYRSPLVSYCRRWLDPHRAEEVVQHTFLKAFLCLRDDDRPLALRPWLYRVAHNASLNALEKKGSDWEQLDENYDGVPQPPQVAEQRARFLRVVDGIDALPGRQREALLLNEFEGRCYADIAAQLGTSESGVRGLLRRARRQLRETAAALLLPFPALRELVRSESGRSFQADRAGEIIGSAGAAGGVGAAGGFAKVAAGVLAAGTLAGGGTALEHRQPAFGPPAAEAQVTESAASPGRSVDRARRTVAASGKAAGDGIALPHTLLSGGVLPSAGSFVGQSESGGTLRASADEPAAVEHDQNLGAGSPEPLVEADPTLVLTDDPKDEESEAQAPDAGAGEGDEPAEQETGSPPGEGEESGTDAEPKRQDDAEPESLPASSGPIDPIRQH